jgi:hypothetical protein
VIARQQQAGESDQDEQHRRPAPGHQRRLAHRPLPLDVGRRLGAPLLGLQVADDGPDALHRRLTAIGAHQGQGRRRVTGPAERDRPIELRHLVGDQRLERGPCAVREIAPEAAHGFRHGHARGGVRCQVAILAGQQVAALGGLRIAQRSHHRVELRQDVGRGPSTPPRDFARVEGAIGEDRDRRDRERGDGEAGQGARRQRTSDDSSG